MKPCERFLYRTNPPHPKSHGGTQLVCTGSPSLERLKLQMELQVSA